VAPVVGFTGRLSTRLPNASQACSIGAISGDKWRPKKETVFQTCSRLLECLLLLLFDVFIYVVKLLIKINFCLFWTHQPFRQFSWCVLHVLLIQ
jgi:hypothetical protein